MGEYLSVITYSDPTQKCPMLDSYKGGMQGPQGVCAIYIYMEVHTEGAEVCFASNLNKILNNELITQCRQYLITLK